MEATSANTAHFKMGTGPKVISFEKVITPIPCPPGPCPSPPAPDVAAGGMLHGLWTSDEVIASSGRDQKVGITNLEDYAGKCRTSKCRATRRHRRSRSSLMCRIRPCGGAKP